MNGCLVNGCLVVGNFVHVCLVAVCHPNACLAIGGLVTLGPSPVQIEPKRFFGDSRIKLEIVAECVKARKGTFDAT